MDLEGKVALVTGAGRGLGRAVCDVLARSGVGLVLGDIRIDLAETAAGDLHGVRALSQLLDVRSKQQAELVIGNALKELGRLDFLINNAAIDYAVSADELTMEQWTNVIDTNLNRSFPDGKTAVSDYEEARWKCHHQYRFDGMQTRVGERGGIPRQQNGDCTD